MAIRPVFKIKEISPFYEEVNVKFTYHSGFAAIQRRRSSESLINEYRSTYGGANVLEVSRFSNNYLGQKLSAFNLMVNLSDGTQVPVENVFQSSKVFIGNRQYLDLLRAKPVEAKTDERIINGGNLVCFRFEGVDFPLEPKTFFYDWIYINALSRDYEVERELLKYEAFTDIVYNPEKSINCQARAVAIFVSLCKYGKLFEAIQNPDSFKDTVYGTQILPHVEQMSLFW